MVDDSRALLPELWEGGLPAGVAGLTLSAKQGLQSCLGQLTGLLDGSDEGRDAGAGEGDTKGLETLQQLQPGVRPGARGLEGAAGKEGLQALESMELGAKGAGMAGVVCRATNRRADLPATSERD